MLKNHRQTVIETLTEAELTELLTSDKPVGLFVDLIDVQDNFYSLAHELCLGYYTQHSANKYISKVYDMYLSRLSKVEADTLLANLIRSKFITKWELTYKALHLTEYDILDSMNYSEQKTGDNVDTQNYDTAISSDSNAGTKVSTTVEDSDNANTFGFNSPTAVPTDSSSSSSVETTSGKAEENTRHKDEKKTGADVNNIHIDETKVNKGRDKSGSELIEKEILMRNRENFFNIVFNDIDSITALSLYY